MNKLLCALFAYVTLCNGNAAMINVTDSEKEKAKSSTIEERILSIAEQAVSSDKPAKRFYELMKENSITSRQIMSVIASIQGKLQNLGYAFNATQENGTTNLDITYNKAKAQGVVYTKDVTASDSYVSMNNRIVMDTHDLCVLLNKQIDALNKIITRLDMHDQRGKKSDNCQQIGEIISLVKPLYKQYTSDAEILVAFMNDIKQLTAKYLPFIQSLKSEYGDLSVVDLLDRYSAKNNITKIGQFEHSGNTDKYTEFMKKRAEERQKELNAMRGVKDKFDKNSNNTITRRISANYTAFTDDNKFGRISKDGNGIVNKNSQDSAYNIIKREDVGSLRYNIVPKDKE